MSSASSSSSSASALMAGHVWRCLDTIHPTMKHPAYAQLFPTSESLEEQFSNLQFAPSLIEALESDTPPSIAFFKTLSTKDTRRWAVYAVVLEKVNSPPKVYIGSGTNRLVGVSARLRNYDTMTCLSMHVERAVKDGYSVTNKGLLCWILMPTLSLLHPRVRAVILATEATLTFMFWTLYSVKGDWGMTHMCPWGRDTLEYEGLCSHAALVEGFFGDLELSAEDMEQQHSELKQRRAAQQAEISRKWEQNLRSNDPEAYRARYITKNTRWAKKNPEKVKMSHKKALANAKAKKKYYCAICDYAAAKKGGLEKHNNSARHIRNATFGRKVPDAKKLKYREIQQKRAQKSVESKEFYCEPCDHAFTSRLALVAHEKKQKHLDNVSRIEELEMAGKELGSGGSPNRATEGDKPGDYGSDADIDCSTDYGSDFELDHSTDYGSDASFDLAK